MRSLFFSVVPCILFATAFPAKCADLVLLPETGGSDSDPTAERFVFAGQPCLLQWVVRGETLANLRKPVCEVYRVSGPTAVPVGELQIPFDAPMPDDAAALVLSTRFEVPVSDRPSRFLLKVWNEAGGERSLLAMIFIRALPAALDFLNGRIVHAIAFTEGDRAGWGSFLENRGVHIEWSDTYPKSPGESDLIFLHLSPDRPSPLPASLADRGRVEIHFDERRFSGDADRITEIPGKVTICRTRLQILRDQFTGTG